MKWEHSLELGSKTNQMVSVSNLIIQVILVDSTSVVIQRKEIPHDKNKKERII